MPERPAPPRDVYLITDRKLRPDRDLVGLVREAVAAGVRSVQLREKDLSAREMHDLAGRLLEVCRPAGARFLINDRLDIALAVGADGVHLPRNGLPVESVRRALGETILIGASTHGLEEARIAEMEGADFLVFGPVFPTPAKLRYGAPLGVDSLRVVLESVRIPVYAIGGIDSSNVDQLAGLPLAGVAVIRALMNAGDIPRTVSRLRGEPVPVNRRGPSPR